MTKTYFEEMARELHWRAVDDTAFGSSGGFLFSVELLNTKEPSRLRVQWVLQEDAVPAAAALQQAPVEHLRWAAGDDACTGHSLVAILAPPSDFYLKSMLHGAVKAATAALAAAGGHPPQACPLCGLSGCDTLAFLQEGYRPAHAACLETRLNLPEKDFTPPGTVKGSWALGALGAVLGAALGALPLVAQALSASRTTVSAAFYAFIPLFSALLYRLLRGKASRNGAGAMVLAASCVTVVFFELILYWRGHNAGYTLSFWQTSALFFESFHLGTQLRAMLWSLLFFVAGLFPAAVIVRRYAASGSIVPRPVRGAAFVRASARPLNAEEETGAAPAKADAPGGEGPAAPTAEDAGSPHK